MLVCSNSRKFWPGFSAHRCRSLCLRRGNRRRQCNSTPLSGWSWFDPRATDAVISQTPLGALSVVISAILSSIFLKEKLTFFGWLGCALCVVRHASKNTLRTDRAALTKPLFQAWLSHHCSQRTHRRLRWSNTRVSKIVPCCGICCVRKCHDCSFDRHCGLRCP